MGNDARKQRRFWLRVFVFSFLFSAFALLIFMARGIIMPTAVAAGLAYLCKPMVYGLRRKGWPGWLAVSTIATTLITFAFIATKIVIGAIPQGADKVEALIKAEYRINRKVFKMLKLDDISDSNQVNSIYKQFPNEVDYLMTKLNSGIRVSKSDFDLYIEELNKQKNPENEILKLHQENLNRSRWIPIEKSGSVAVSDGEVQQHITNVLSSFSTWLLFPIVFFFLLGDNGNIFKYIMGFVPNQYFELVITMLERVDRALGHYLRGTAIECLLVGLTIGLGLFIFGVTAPFAILIGAISGITNAIPFVGTLVGLILGFAYALMADQINPLLPFLTADDLLIGVVASITVAHFLDNALFQPILVGKAVHLHPIVVILSVAAGGMAFGIIGVVLAIPGVVVINTCLKTLVNGLKDYRLI